MSETPTPTSAPTPHVHTGEVVEFDATKLLLVLGVASVVGGILYYLWKRSKGGSLRDVGQEIAANGERLIAEYVIKPADAPQDQEEYATE